MTGLQVSLAALGLLCASVVSAQVPDCSTDNNHHRWERKNQDAPDDSLAPTAVTIRQIVNWSIPGKSDGERTKNEALHPREDEPFILTGVLRLIKLSEDDCDLHLEIATSRRSNANRIIAEIPQAFSDLQESFYRELGLNSGRKEFTADEGPIVAVAGFAFLDVSHRCAGKPKKGCNHGSAGVATIWELHPVFRAWVERWPD